MTEKRQKAAHQMKSTMDKNEITAYSTLTPGDDADGRR
jgi:hypothetical protein